MISIKQLRLDRNMSQIMLAAACRPPISTDTIYRAEHGGSMHLKTLQSICEALGVECEEVEEFSRVIDPLAKSKEEYAAFLASEKSSV